MERSSTACAVQVMSAASCSRRRSSCAFFVQVAILGVGAWLVVNSELTAGAMIAASILLGRALAPVELAISVWRNFIGARFSYDRLKKTIRDYPAPSKRTKLPSPNGTVAVNAI